MFDWGHSLYSALRAAFIGALLGLLFGIAFVMAGDRVSPGFPIIMFWLFGLARLGWDVFNKQYPDA